MSRVHHVDYSPRNLFWGYFDAATPPVIEIESGDEVVLDCLPAAGPDELPADGAGVLPGHREAMAEKAADRGATSHFMTGPVFVRGARPGDVLQVDILEVTPIQTWGYTGIMPLRGALPDEFTNYQTMHIAIDLERNVCRLPWGTELALAPFFGILAVAPPPEWGRISAAPPRAFGGNMDNRDLQAGDHPLPSGLQRRRALLRRRRARAAGRRRGLHRRAGNLADRPLPPHGPQGHADRRALRRVPPRS